VVVVVVVEIVVVAVEEVVGVLPPPAVVEEVDLVASVGKETPEEVEDREPVKVEGGLLETAPGERVRGLAKVGEAPSELGAEGRVSPEEGGGRLATSPGDAASEGEGLFSPPAEAGVLCSTPTSPPPSEPPVERLLSPSEEERVLFSSAPAPPSPSADAEVILPPSEGLLCWLPSSPPPSGVAPAEALTVEPGNWATSCGKPKHTLYIFHLSLYFYFCD